ncbi:MAG TPA: cupin domain-containing protein [Chloroflexota bacterium]
MAATETRPAKPEPKGPVEVVNTAWESGERNVKNLARTDLLTVLLHHWDSGGEIAAHYHTDSDACWVVLEGQATFRDAQDNILGQANAHEAVVVPRNTTYWFENTGEGAAVMFRISARLQGPPDAPRTDDRVYLESRK